MRLRALVGQISVSAVLSAMSASQAAIVALPIAGFTGSETVVTYGPLGTTGRIDGVTLGGVLHNFSIADVPSPEAYISDGPGVTNNLYPAIITGNSEGVLSLTFASLQSRIGFGWAISGDGGGTIELFDLADVSLGSLHFSGEPDPTYEGGFAGLESSMAFAKAEVSWSRSSSFFGFDNLRFEPMATVPEPASFALVGVALLGLAVSRRRP